MDAGLAAVCGALAGSMATIGAALAAGRAQREGARIGARAEHRKERRQPRQDAYKALISAASEMRDIRKGPKPGLREEQRAYDANSKIQEAWTDVALLGPSSVSNLASAIREKAAAFSTLMWALYGIPNVKLSDQLYGSASTDAEKEKLRDGYWKSLDVLENEIAAAIEAFSAAARSALDDDGSQRLRRWPARR
ncbi:hypothetical protein ACFRMQ_09560 [Kitasatospora sp. NPDC056783]|uniref:hypothetical protein n=1 Tax=Kitasatospora sp. NPDC056783 TaxID=3345943 RepID=UPI0036B4449A